MTHADRLMFYAGIIAIILGFVSLLYVLFTFIYPYKFIEVNSIRVLNNPQPGESIEILVDACKFIESELKTTYILFYVQEVSEFNLVTNSTESAKIKRQISTSTVQSSSGVVGCTRFIDPTVSLPENSKPGDYEILVTLSFKVNNYHDVQYRYEIPFTSTL